MKTNLRLSCLLVTAGSALTIHPSAAQDSLFIPSEVYYPPQTGTERQALAEMSALAPELQGAYTRGKHDAYLRIILRAFRRRERDLADYFRWSYGPTGSAASSEMTNDVTLGLLYHWGDKRFAAVLAGQPPEIRRGVGKHFWLQKANGNSAFIKGFPATAQAALLVR